MNLRLKNKLEKMSLDELKEEAKKYYLYNENECVDRKICLLYRTNIHDNIDNIIQFLYGYKFLLQSGKENNIYNSLELETDIDFHYDCVEDIYFSYSFINEDKGPSKEELINRILSHKEKSSIANKKVKDKRLEKELKEYERLKKKFENINKKKK